jgi:hypothetical protein
MRITWRLAAALCGAAAALLLCFFRPVPEIEVSAPAMPSGHPRTDAHTAPAPAKAAQSQPPPAPRALVPRQQVSPLRARPSPPKPKRPRSACDALRQECPVAEMVQQLAVENTVVVTFGNARQRHFTQNWVYHLQVLGVRGLLVGMMNLHAGDPLCAPPLRMPPPSLPPARARRSFRLATATERPARVTSAASSSLPPCCVAAVRGPCVTLPRAHAAASPGARARD